MWSVADRSSTMMPMTARRVSIGVYLLFCNKKCLHRPTVQAKTGDKRRSPAVYLRASVERYLSSFPSGDTLGVSTGWMGTVGGGRGPSAAGVVFSIPQRSGFAREIKCNASLFYLRNILRQFNIKHRLIFTELV